MNARQKQNIATFHNQQAERLRQPALSDAALASNRRLADSLAKTGDFSAIKRHVASGLDEFPVVAFLQENTHP